MQGSACGISLPAAPPDTLKESQTQENTRHLPPIISAHGLSKRYGAAPLFQDISFNVSEGDRVGIIGPNGSGKSTLLEILNGRVNPDSGDAAIRKNTRLSLVQQVSEFAAGETIRSIIEKALDRAKVPRERPPLADR